MVPCCGSLRVWIVSSTRRPWALRGPFRWIWVVILLPLGTCGLAAAPTLPFPPQLARDVNFWIRVDTEIGSDAGFLYDKYHLGVIYATLCFAP